MRYSIGEGKPNNTIVIPNRSKSDLLMYIIRKCIGAGPSVPWDTAYNSRRVHSITHPSSPRLLESKTLLSSLLLEEAAPPRSPSRSSARRGPPRGRDKLLDRLPACDGWNPAGSRGPFRPQRVYGSEDTRQGRTHMECGGVEHMRVHQWRSLGSGCILIVAWHFRQ
jgi:hypothetical protein